MPFEINLEEPRNDLSIIDEILAQISAFLGRLFASPSDYGLYYFIDIQSSLLDAFEAEAPIESKHSQMMEQIAVAPEEVRVQMGLTGKSLRAKASAFNQLADRLRKGIVGTIKWLLGLVNSFLASTGRLSSFAEGLKELKDLFENSTDFAEAIK